MQQAERLRRKQGQRKPKRHRQSKPSGTAPYAARCGRCCAQLLLHFAWA